MIQTDRDQQFQDLILTRLTRDIQCVSLLRMGQSVIRCTMYANTELWKLHMLFLGNRNSATPDTKNHLKNHPLDVAKKYVETYSSSNAAAQDPEERVQLINMQ